MHNNPSLKHYSLNWLYCNETIAADIEYWSKSYSITMKSPYHVKIAKNALTFSIPTHFCILEENVESVADTINLIPIAKKLCELWVDHKESNMKTMQIAATVFHEAARSLDIEQMKKAIRALYAKVRAQKVLYKASKISQKEYQKNRKEIRHVIDMELNNIKDYVENFARESFAQGVDINISDKDIQIWEYGGTIEPEDFVARYLIEAILLTV